MLAVLTTCSYVCRIMNEKISCSRAYTSPLGTSSTTPRHIEHILLEMFALDISNTKRPPTHQSVRQRASTPLSRTLLVDIDRGRVTAEQVQEMTAHRAQLATPTKRSRTPPVTGGAHPRGNSTIFSTPQTAKGSPSKEASRLSSSSMLPSPVQKQGDEGRVEMSAAELSMHLASFTDICEKAPQGVNPSWVLAKQHAEQSQLERSARSNTRSTLVDDAKKSLDAKDAIEIARLVAKQEEMDRRELQRRSVKHQVSRFAALELKVREGLVSQEERAELFRPSESKSQDDIMESTVERHRARQGADRAFRQIEPQHMMRMSSRKILKEDELASFGDELQLLASKSDTARLVGNRNREARNALMNQLMSWSQGVLARGDLSDMLEEFIKRCTLTADGSIRLADIHDMMEHSGIRLSASDRDAFNDAVDPRGRGCVVPERLRHVWRSHEAVRRVKTMDVIEAEELFDVVRAEIPGPITATVLSTWFKRTGAPVDADVCHTILQRLPRPVTKETIFSDTVFAFLQDVWLDARASEREVLTDAGMMERAKQLEALSADTNDTLEEVDRAARLMHNSSHRLVGMHEQLQETLEATAKLARRVPKTYTKSTAQNTDVSVTGEMVMLWEGFLVQRDLDLLDNDEDDKLTTILSKQNQSKADEIVRLRTAFESVHSKFRHKEALLTQKLEAEELTSKNLKRMLEQATVGPGGMLDFEQHEAVLEAQTREVNELTAQMNHKLALLRGEHQSKVRELIYEVTHHKTRADEAERKFLEEVENTRHLESKWNLKIESLEDDVRGREEAVNSTNQVIAEYETKYVLQEKAFEQIEAKLQEANNEAEKLREQIHIYESETHGIMVPQAEVDRRLATLEAQLLQQVSTEKASKEQFARQLQTVKSELQRLEFSSLDKCGALEQEMQTLRCERDELEKDVHDAAGKTLRVLDAVVQLALQDRSAIGQCTDVLGVHGQWLQSSQATLQQLAEVIEGVQRELPQDPTGGSNAASDLEDLQRRLQQSSQRTFSPPTNSVVEKLNAMTAELASVSAALSTSDKERLSLADVVESVGANTTRVLSQLEEFAAECIDAAVGGAKLSSSSLENLDAQTFVSTESLPEAMASAVHAVCTSWRRRLGEALDTIGQRFVTLEGTLQALRDEEAKGNRRHSISLEDTKALQQVRRMSAHMLGTPAESESPVGRLQRGGSITVLVAPIAEARHEEEQHLGLLVEASEASEAVYAQLEAIRGLLGHQERRLLPVVLEHTEQSLSRVTRDDLARLATQKRAVAAAQSSWRQHLWQFAIRTCILSARAAASASTSTEMSPIHVRLGSLWKLRWSVEGVTRAAQLVDAIGALAITVTTMMSTALTAAADSPLSQKRTRSSVAVVADPAPSAPPSAVERPQTPPPQSPPTAVLPSVKSAAKLSRAASSVGFSRKSSTAKQPQQPPVVSPPMTPTQQGAPLSPLGVPIAESIASHHTASMDRRRTSSLANMQMQRSTSTVQPMPMHVEDEESEREIHLSADSTLRVVDDAIEDMAELHEGGHEDDDGTGASSPYGVSVRSDMFPRFEKIVRSDQHNRSPVEELHSQHGNSSVLLRRRSSVAAAPAAAHSAPSPRAAMRNFGCQVTLAPATVTQVVERRVVEARPVRPGSHTRETQTPPPALDVVATGPPPHGARTAAAATPPTEGLMCETPTGSQASETVPWLPSAAVDPQRRVDSAQRRRMVPRPQSSERPRSAIPLDDESAGALRAVPTTPTSRPLQHDDPHTAAANSNGGLLAAAHDRPHSTWEDMRKRIHIMQSGNAHYVDFPTAAQLGDHSAQQVDLDNALSYLFDSLPPHCRVAAGKYCLLAIFGCITEDVFVESVFTNHYLPHRELFVAPRDDDLRRSFHQLRRVGGLLMRLRMPTDDRSAMMPHPQRAQGGTLVPHKGQVTSRIDKVLEDLSYVTSVGAAVSDMTFPLGKGGRPFSANSFPATVVVLPLQDDQPHGRVHDDPVTLVPVEKRLASLPVRATSAASTTGHFKVLGASLATTPPTLAPAPQDVLQPPPPSLALKQPIPTFAVPVQEQRPSSRGTSQLPRDLSAVSNGTIGPADALVVMSRVEQTTIELGNCGQQLQSLRESLQPGEQEPGATQTHPPASRVSTPSGAAARPTVMEFNATDSTTRRSASTISEAARQKVLGRPTKRLPILGARRDVSSAEVTSTAAAATLQVRPSSTLVKATHVMNDKIAEYLASSSQSAARQGPPMVATRLAPLSRLSTPLAPGQGRPPITNAVTSTTTSQVLPAAEVVVDLPTVTRRK